MATSLTADRAGTPGHLPGQPRAAAAAVQAATTPRELLQVILMATMQIFQALTSSSSLWSPLVLFLLYFLVMSL